MTSRCLMYNMPTFLRKPNSTFNRFRPGYFEVDIDVGSSALASYATHLAGGYAKHVVLDLAFALQVMKLQ